MMVTKFNVGDRVVIDSHDSLNNGKKGTVKKVNGTFALVVVDMDKIGCRNCVRWFLKYNLNLVERKQKDLFNINQDSDNEGKYLLVDYEDRVSFVYNRITELDEALENYTECYDTSELDDILDVWYFHGCDVRRLGIKIEAKVQVNV